MKHNTMDINLYKQQPKTYMVTHELTNAPARITINERNVVIEVDDSNGGAVVKLTLDIDMFHLFAHWFVENEYNWQHA